MNEAYKDLMDLVTKHSEHEILEFSSEQCEKYLTEIWNKASYYHNTSKIFKKGLETTNVLWVPDLIKIIKNDLAEYPKDPHGLHDIKYIKHMKNSDGTYKNEFVMYGAPQELPGRYDLDSIIHSIKSQLIKKDNMLMSLSDMAKKINSISKKSSSDENDIMKAKKHLLEVIKKHSNKKTLAKE